MKCLSLKKSFLFLISLMHTYCLAEVPIGKVALTDQEVWIEQGEIFFTRAGVGDELKVNAFGQYQDTSPIPAYVKWFPQTRRKAKPQEPFQEKEILHTSKKAKTKIALDDGSVLNIGPRSLVQFTKFNLESHRKFFKQMIGTIHFIVPSKQQETTSYQISTPGLLLGVRKGSSGTEFIVKVETMGRTETKTTVLVLHGQVSVDVAKIDSKGTVYHIPYVVNPGNILTSSGQHGLGEETKVTFLNNQESREIFENLSPRVNSSIAGAAYVAKSTALPGTGICRENCLQNQKRGLASSETSIFDQTRLLGKTSNFQVPEDIEFAKEHRRENLKFLQPPPIGFLPGNFSRVEVNLTGN